MRRTKTGRQPRGVLLVPGLKESEAAELAGDDEPTEERTEESADEDAAALMDDVPSSEPERPRAEPATASSASTLVGRLGRPAAFAVLLVALALAGVLVGRLLRGTGDGTPAALPASTTSTVGTTPTPAPKPTFETWGPFKATPGGALARPAARAAAAVAGTRVVVLGGSSGNAVQLGKPGGRLRSVGSLPSRRAGAAAFVDSGAVYLIGGEDGAAVPSDEIVRVDLGSNAVTSAGRFVEPLSGAGYVQTGRSLILVGGWTGEKYATAVLRFTLPDTADVVARLPEATRDAAVAVRGDTLYVAGGRTATGLSNAVYAVNLGAGTVSVLGRLPRAVAGGSLVSAGGKLYLLGGKDRGGPVRSIFRIDPATGRIDPAGRMPKPLAGAAAVHVAGGTLLIGGTRPTSITRLEVG